VNYEIEVAAPKDGHQPSTSNISQSQSDLADTASHLIDVGSHIYPVGKGKLPVSQWRRGLKDYALDPMTIAEALH
jgi:hypothetical protein